MLKNVFVVLTTQRNKYTQRKWMTKMLDVNDRYFLFQFCFVLIIGAWNKHENKMDYLPFNEKRNQDFELSPLYQ